MTDHSNTKTMRKTKVINIANGAFFLFRGKLFLKVKSKYTSIVVGYDTSSNCRKAMNPNWNVWELNQNDLIKYEGNQSEDIRRCQNL